MRLSIGRSAIRRIEQWNAKRKLHAGCGAAAQVATLHRPNAPTPAELMLA
jgi:hypothetical protein